MSMTDNIYILLGAAAFITALAYMVCALPKIDKRKLTVRLAVLRGLTFVCLTCGVMFVVSFHNGSEPVYRAADSWLRVAELGYKAIWLEMAVNMGAFVPFGIMLPLAYKRVNKIGIAVIAGVLTGALTAGAMALAGCFMTDAAVYAALGTVTGFSLLTLFGWIFTKIKYIKRIGFSKKTHTAGVFFLLAVYFAGVGALLLDSGSEYVPLNLFKPEQQLPQLALTAELSDETSKQLTYKTVQPDMKTDPKLIAEACQVQGEPIAQGERVKVVNGAKTVVVSPTGEWRYTDSAAAVGMVSDNDAVDSAMKFINSKLLKNFSITGYTIEQTFDGDTESGKRVYLEMGIGGKKIRGSCEIGVEVGPGGAIKDALKSNAYFEGAKTVGIISSQQAFLKAAAGDCGHTLFEKADSATVSSAEIAYWLEEVKGVLQPIWLFTGTAAMPNGEEKTFEIYVPAIK